MGIDQTERQARRLAAKRRRRRQRILVSAGVGGAILIAAAASVLGPSQEEKAAKRFMDAWADEDYDEMHGLLGDDAKEKIGPRAFAFAYRHAAATATTERVRPGDADGEGEDRVRVPMTMSTRAFGTVRGDLELRVDRGRVHWEPHLAFPGLRPGETLTRRTSPPRRAAILARGGRTIVEGPASQRRSPLGLPAAQVAGSLGRSSDPPERERLYARGFDRDATLGTGGLERVFEREVAGTPGGTLLAGKRRIASSRPRPARAVRTTIDADVQAAAAAALGGRFGGIAALDARTAEVRAVVGIAMSSPQPPGSTFKIVTTAAALERDLVKPTTTFPQETRAVIDGVPLRNAGGESCGGTFTNSFAHSCNSVFAPLGVKVGAKRLVEAAERFGVNRQPAIRSVARSTMPRAKGIESRLALGATAIGQGKVLMTPLALASATQVIAARGIRREPSLTPGRGRNRETEVTSRRIAGTIEKLMTGVVRFGTGKSGGLPGVEVAGKTGTAELGPDAGEHAWFTAYAPTRRPEIVVAILVVRGGFGGEVAAPLAPAVLRSGMG